MQKILINIIMSMGMHNAVQLLLKLAKIIVEKTKTQKDDKVVQTLIELWDELEPIIPKVIKQGLK